MSLYHAFLTHDWGKNRMNHEKVAVICHALQRRGILCWFDEEQMIGNVSKQMASGIDSSAVVVAFVTERYRDKVNSDNMGDNCLAEFQYSKLKKTSQRMLAVVLEEKMKRIDNWGNGLLPFTLGNDLFCTMCGDISDKNYLKDRVDELATMIRKKIDPRVLKELDARAKRELAGGVSGSKPSGGAHQLPQQVAGLSIGEGKAAENIDGGGWKLVRHIPAGYTWHPATDQLNGTDVYGNSAHGALGMEAWSVKFDQMKFNEFLFATGDEAKWLIAAKREVMGWYANEGRTITKSSMSALSYKAKWYRRQGAKEDPWISLTDHASAIPMGHIVYGENNFGADHAKQVLPKHKGANVFIRNKVIPGAGPAEGIDGGGWRLVRHVPAGYSWHPATDQLTGTEAYGNPAHGAAGMEAWSIKFDNENFSEFLFATGDLSKWLVTGKDQVIGWYANEPRTIAKSSMSSLGYKAKWYRRQGSMEDPWISLTDHHMAIGNGQIMYGENNFGGDHAKLVLPKHKGANVFIR